MTFGECGLLFTYTVMFYCRKDNKEEVRKSLCGSISCRLKCQNFYVQQNEWKIKWFWFLYQFRSIMNPNQVKMWKPILRKSALRRKSFMNFLLSCFFHVPFFIWSVEFYSSFLLPWLMLFLFRCSEVHFKFDISFEL